MPSPTTLNFVALPNDHMLTAQDELHLETAYKQQTTVAHRPAQDIGVYYDEETLNPMILDSQENVMTTQFSDCGDANYSSSSYGDEEDDDMYSYIEDDDDIYDDDDDDELSSTVPHSTYVVLTYGQKRTEIPLRYAGQSWTNLPGAVPLKRTNTCEGGFVHTTSIRPAQTWSPVRACTNLSYRPAGRALGSGSGGSVTLYHRELDGMPVAVKRFAAARVGETLDHRRNKVDAEISMLCSLNHPNIMSVLDVIELPEAEDNLQRRIVSDGASYSNDTRTVKLMVTECFPSDLFSAVEGDLAPYEARRLFYQLLSAVAHMHSRGVAHRDLKLENVCMDRYNNLKVIDLGNAVRHPTGQYSDKALSFGVYGSDPYVPPEAWHSLQWWMTMVNGGNPIRNDVTDPEAKLAGAGYNPFHADLWALGILLITMTQKSFAWWRADNTDAGFNWFRANRAAFLQTFTEPWQRLAADALLRERPEERVGAAQLLEQLKALELHEAQCRGYAMI
jgi:hypothetical protein